MTPEAKRSLGAGTAAWLSTCAGSLGIYLQTLQSWADWHTLPVASGAAGLAAIGLAALAKFIGGKSAGDSAHVDTKPESEPL